MKSKKIGLAVVTYKDNFGSALQTFATQYKVSQLGYPVECVTTDGIQSEIDSKKKLYYLGRIFNKEEFAYLWSFVTSHFIRKKVKNAIYTSNMAIRHEQYTDFNNKFLKFSPRVDTIAELHNLASTYESIIVGSDQLWRPSNIAGEYFTLEFAPSTVKKIAYSTSFGVAKLHRSIQKHAIKFLKDFDWISVRENSGRTIVMDMIHRDIPVVCDPTMLLTVDEWNKYVPQKPIIDGDYIVCYIMGESCQQREFIKKLREITGYRVVGLLHGSNYNAGDDEWVDEAPYNVGPFDFINLIKYAKYVCTDSFHCSVFSILNNTPFFVFRRDSDNEETSANDRIYTLLSWSGLDNRLLFGTEDVKACIDLKIDYKNVNEKVTTRREESLEYLITALNSTK